MNLCGKSFHGFRLNLWCDSRVSRNHVSLSSPILNSSNCTFIALSSRNAADFAHFRLLIIGPGGGVLGFGYDSSSNAYKGVALELLGEKTVSVYNMGEGGYYRRRTIQVSHLPNLVLQGAAVYVRNNTLNWLATLEMMPWYDETESTNSEPYTILSFDMGKEELTQFSLPYCPRCEDDFEDFEPILGVLRDSLCVSQNDIDNQTRNFVVWQMKEFGVHKSWTQLFNIIIDAGDKCIPWPCFATCLSENGDALLLSKSGVSQAVLYIRRENKLEATKIANNIVGCYVENYIESLVSPC